MFGFEAERKLENNFSSVIHLTPSAHSCDQRGSLLHLESKPHKTNLTAIRASKPRHRTYNFIKKIGVRYILRYDTKIFFTELASRLELPSALAPIQIVTKLYIVYIHDSFTHSMFTF